MEIKAIVYAAVMFALVAVGAWAGDYYVTEKWDAAKLAQDTAIQKQEAQIIDLTKQRDALTAQVQTSHEQILANGATLTAGITSSVRSIEAALHSSAVRSTVANPGSIQGTLASHGIDPSITNAVASVGVAIAALTTACTHIDADRTAIIALEPH
jgi:hypothetical protein